MNSPKISCMVPLNSVAAAVINTALFAQGVAYPPAGDAAIPLSIKAADVRPFLLWKRAERGGQAAHTVGRPFDAGQRVWLPISGAAAFVPSFGADRLAIRIADTLAFEEACGILTPGTQRRQELRVLDPRTLAVQQIARIGACEITAIDELCNTHPAASALHTAFDSVLRDTFLDGDLSLLAVEELAAFFAELMAIFRAFEDTHHTGAYAYQAGVTDTWILPKLEYAVETGRYVRRCCHSNPEGGPADAPVTSIVLSERERAGYHLMTRLGDFGDPLLLAALRIVQTL